MPTDDFQRNMAHVRRTRREAARVAVHTMAEHVLGEAMRRAPHDQGTLEASGHLEPLVEEHLTAEQIIFATPYAAAQHEGMWQTGPLAGVRITNYTTPGTGPKYLEGPLLENGDRFHKLLAAADRKALTGRLPHE